MSNSNTPKYAVLSGTISNLHTETTHVHFLKNIKHQQQMAGALAVVQAATGQAGAVFSAQAATDEGDPVQGFIMQVDGKIVQGSFWKTTFKDGDEVQVIGEERNGVLHAIALTKPAERMIWMQPHCERGTEAKKKSVLRACGYFVVFCIFAELCLLATSKSPYVYDIFLGLSVCIVTLTLTAGMSWRDFMVFAREMNAVAMALGLPEPEKIDLFKSTKAALQAGKPELPMGVYYY